MAIIGEERLSPDIQQETFNQNTGTENRILIVWYKKLIKQRKNSSQQYHLPGLKTKKACYTSYISFYLKYIYAHPVTNI